MLTITDREFRQLADYIKQNYGIHLREEKRALLIGRLHNELIRNNIHSFSDYYQYIISDKTGEAAISMINRVTTNHTFFMREPDHFYFFRDKALPSLINSVKKNDLRIWSAGCSSGEEPYTLAMILDEFFGADKPKWDTKVLATDISSRALSEAVNAVYSREEINPIPAQWKMKYFEPVNNDFFRIEEKLKKEVLFRKFNLMNEFPFRGRFHVIFCRNVMIYFDAQTKSELVEKFYNHMEYGGYLFIGHSESLNRDETQYKYIMPSVYKKV